MKVNYSGYIEITIKHYCTAFHHPNAIHLAKLVFGGVAGCVIGLMLTEVLNIGLPPRMVLLLGFGLLLLTLGMIFPLIFQNTESIGFVRVQQLEFEVNKKQIQCIPINSPERNPDLPGINLFANGFTVTKLCVKGSNFPEYVIEGRPAKAASRFHKQMYLSRCAEVSYVTRAIKFRIGSQYISDEFKEFLENANKKTKTVVENEDFVALENVKDYF